MEENIKVEYKNTDTIKFNGNEEINDNSEITEELKLEENNEDKNCNKNDNNNDNNETNKNLKKKKKKKKKNKVKKIEIEEETEEDKIIKETMGFNKFSSTKNQSHKDTDISGVFLGRKAKRIYQRFMNYKPFSKILKQAYMSLNQEF